MWNEHMGDGNKNGVERTNGKLCDEWLEKLVLWKL